MDTSFTLRPVARIRSDFPDKFGIPRQSGLVDELESVLVFEPEYRSAESLRGLEGFSHIWLLWIFDRSLREGWSPTVRPPRLGGNARMGVFATRSPFRPNPVGLSCVRLERIETGGAEGPLLYLRGADLADGTPVLDVKPYIPFVDSVPDAAGGFARGPDPVLEVRIPPELRERIPADRLAALRGVLAQDPRPHYHRDPERVYGFGFAGMEIRFTVDGGVLTVTGVE